MKVQFTMSKDSYLGKAKVLKRTADMWVFLTGQRQFILLTQTHMKYISLASAVFHNCSNLKLSVEGLRNTKTLPQLPSHQPKTSTDFRAVKKGWSVSVSQATMHGSSHPG